MATERAETPAYAEGGRVWLYVRTEQREASGGTKQIEHLFVCAHDRQVWTRWFPTWPHELEPVNDVGGRSEATHWASIAEAERAKADALTVAMKALAQSCDSRVVEQARQVYLAEIEKAGVKVDG